ncbi:MAG: hypothetical protein CMQ16_10055, partial [Gammaproteobacteria bacterium]|nr:hypothetical protein [Gammaproteobacteria bacterium]
YPQTSIPLVCSGSGASARFTKLICGLSISATLNLHADQTDERLSGLFEQLSRVSNPVMLRATENRIWEIWLEHENIDVQRLVTLGTEAMNRRQFPEALLIFSQIVENFPDFAEGWNKRATLYYLVGNTDASIEDIKRALELEPRHFGALSGLGLVYLQQGKLALAEEAFLQLITIHPNSPSAQDNLRLVREQRAVNVI